MVRSNLHHATALKALEIKVLLKGYAYLKLAEVILRSKSQFTNSIWIIILVDDRAYAAKCILKKWLQ